VNEKMLEFSGEARDPQLASGAATAALISNSTLELEHEKDVREKLIPLDKSQSIRL
jgi:hypothetical protein